MVRVGSVVSSERRTRALKNHVRISARKKKVETRKRSLFPRTMRVTAIVKIEQKKSSESTAIVKRESGSNR